MRDKRKIGCVVRISPSWSVELMRMRGMNERMRGMKENERNEWEWEEWMREWEE